MSVKKDESGRRWISVEAEVPGTPEEVWKAIATGEGISSWFVPTEIDETKGAMTMHFGPGMDSVATRTSYDPPRKFSAESDGLGPNAPTMATEWTVEAKSGGTCVVRVVHSLFASTDDWDNQLESIESGWPSLFQVLALYLRNFRGQKCSNVSVTGVAPGPEEAVWSNLATKLGLKGSGKDDGVPPFSGSVEKIREAPHAVAILHLAEPAPGLGLVTTCNMGGPVMASVNLYLYGDAGARASAKDSAAWQEWAARTFPTP